MCRKPCKDCPWIEGGKNHETWPAYVEQAINDGKWVQDSHVCHKIDNDTWGEVNEKNVCVGSKIHMKKMLKSLTNINT